MSLSSQPVRQEEDEANLVKYWHILPIFTFLKRFILYFASLKQNMYFILLKY